MAHAAMITRRPLALAASYRVGYIRAVRVIVLA
jgi:hypothetical protein